MLRLCGILVRTAHTDCHAESAETLWVVDMCFNTALITSFWLVGVQLSKLKRRGAMGHRCGHAGVACSEEQSHLQVVPGSVHGRTVAMLRAAFRTGSIRRPKHIIWAFRCSRLASHPNGLLHLFEKVEHEHTHSMLHMLTESGTSAATRRSTHSSLGTQVLSDGTVRMRVR
jgi:hypothetical protein